MNSTTIGTEGEYEMVLINMILTFLTLLINAHQSYKGGMIESECCGKPLLKVIENVAEASSDVPLDKRGSKEYTIDELLNIKDAFVKSRKRKLEDIDEENPI